MRISEDKNRKIQNFWKIQRDKDKTNWKSSF